MKVKNRLLNFENKIIYQDDDYFCFSIDSVLLANFVTIKLSDKKIIDLCSGNAPIPMLLSYRTKARIFGVELQEYIYELGNDSINENNMSNQITFLNCDVMDLHKKLLAEEFDVVTCNPPYFKYGEKNLINDNLGKAIARHEIKINLDDVVGKANYLLKNGGTFALIHRPDRLIEIINIMQKYGIEPKKIQFVYPKVGKNASNILIEGVKNGRSGIKLLSPLIVYDDNNKYTEVVSKMFGSDIDVAK